MTPDSRGVLLVLSACNFVIGMGAFIIIGMVEPIAAGLGVPVTAAGGLLTVYAVTFACVAPLIVALTGRIGRRRIITFGLALFTLATALAALAPGLGWLYAARMLAPVGAGLVTPVTLAVAAALAPPEARGRALSTVFIGLTLAQVAGVPAGSWIAYTFGWRAAFALVVLMAFPCLWLVWTRVPAGLRFDPVSLRDLGTVLRDPQAMLTVAFTVVFLGAIYVPFSYLAVILSERMAFGRDGISLALLLFGAAAPVGNFIGGWLADRFGPVPTLAAICLCEIAAMPFLSLLPLPVGVVMASVAVWSLVGWSFSPSQQLRLVGLDPKRAPVLLSLHAASIYVGIAAGSAIGGVVIGTVGVDGLGLAGSVCAFLALALLLWSHRAANLRAARF